MHIPVLLGEVLRLLSPKPGDVIFDGTLGAGGHALALAKETGQNGVLVGVDRDPRALALAKETLKDAPCALKLFNNVYSDPRTIAHEAGVPGFDVCLLDLGVSSMQLDEPGRGFGFRTDEPLDMQMNPGDGVSLTQWLSQVGEQELADVLYTYGEERKSRRIAKALVTARRETPIRTTGQLADLVARALRSGKASGKHFHVHPATRTFQALRIWVNRELDHLEAFLKGFPEAVNPGARVGIISFHSLEDRMVKQAFRACKEKGATVVTKKSGDRRKVRE